MDKTCGLSLYPFHSFDEESVRACSAEHPEEYKEQKVFRVQGRFEDEEEGEEKQARKEILVKSDEHARKLKRQLSVQDSEYRKCQTRQQSPEDTHKG